MSITDELRYYATLVERGTRTSLNKLANSIDKEHEREVADARNDALYRANDKDMAELGWVKLPVDADGKTIHFGDVLDQFGTPMTVVAMSDPDPDQGDCMLQLTTDGLDDTWVRARKMRHHHEPTVEDVLREFGKCWDDPAHYAKGELVEAYADRIREALRDE